MHYSHIPEIVGDIYFVPNADQQDTAISSSPFTLQYNWRVIALLSDFNLSSFSFSPKDFFNLGLKLFSVSEEQVLVNAMNLFVVPNNSGTKNDEQFARKY